MAPIIRQRPAGIEVDLWDQAFLNRTWEKLRALFPEKKEGRRNLVLLILFYFLHERGKLIAN